MKNKAAALLALILCVTLTACGSSSSAAQSAPAQQEAGTEAAEEDDFWAEESTENAQADVQTEIEPETEEESTAQNAGASLENILESAEESTEEEVAEAAFSPGVYEGDTYTQPYFGIRTTRSDNMTWTDTAGLLEVSGIDADWNDSEAIEAALSNSFLMDLQGINTGGDTLMVEIFKVTMSEDKMLADLTSAMESSFSGDQVTNVKTREEEKEIMGEPRRTVLFTATVQGVDLYMRFYSYSKGPYTIVFYASTLYEDRTMDLLGGFEKVE